MNFGLGEVIVIVCWILPVVAVIGLIAWLLRRRRR